MRDDRFKHLYTDNPLLIFLGKKGISLTYLADTLGITYPSLRNWIKKPSKHLTIIHLMIISSLTNTPLIYIIGLCMGIKTKDTQSWYNDQMQTIDLTFLTNIPTNDKTKDT